MSGVMEDDDGMDDLRDERLRRALAHAPDHGAVPDWRTRKAILEQAREAVAPSLASAAPERSWWQRLLGLGGADGGARMPWNAAFATVLVAVLVTVLWQREPVPGARLDGETSAAAPASRPAESPAPPAAPAAPAAAPPSPPVAEPAPTPVPVPPPQASERALPSSEDIPGTPLPPPEAAPPAPAAKAARPARAQERSAGAPAEPARRQAEEAAPSASNADRAKEARKREAAAMQPAPPPAMAAAPAAAAPSPGQADASASREGSLEGLRREAERSASNQRFAGPSGAAAAARDAVEPARAAAAAAPPAPRAAEAGEPPSFAALSQWSRMTITPRGGAGRSLSRAEATELNALLGSAALSAVGPQALAGAAEWRVTLERGNGELLATFELGRNQVRWREGQKAATTGAPSAASLAALRDALQRAVEPPAPAPAQPPALQWRPAQPPAESEPAPSAPSR